MTAGEAGTPPALGIAPQAIDVGIQDDGRVVQGGAPASYRTSDLL